MTSTDSATGARDVKNHDVSSFADFGKEMWAYLTGRGAAIDYEFVDMSVEVPRETGPNSPRANTAGQEWTRIQIGLAPSSRQLKSHG